MLVSGNFYALVTVPGAVWASVSEKMLPQIFDDTPPPPFTGMLTDVNWHELTWRDFKKVDEGSKHKQLCQDTDRTHAERKTEPTVFLLPDQAQ